MSALEEICVAGSRAEARALARLGKWWASRSMRPSVASCFSRTAPLWEVTMVTAGL